MSGGVDDPLELTAPYRVRFDEAGPDGLVRTSSLLRYAQDVGWQHSEARGLTRAWYAERGLAWVVRAAAIDVDRPIPMGTTFAVTTRVLGYQRVWARRRATFVTPDQATVATVGTDWVLIDGRGRLARVPEEIPGRFPAPLLDGSILRVAPPPEGRPAAHRSFAVRPHELDPMNHPNNAVYVDWLEELLLAAGGEAEAAVAACPRRLELEYAAAPGPGAIIEAEGWPAGPGWSVRFTSRGVGHLFRATLVPDARRVS